MSDDSFTHDQEAFEPGEAPGGAVISDDEARYADVVAEIIWDGALDSEASRRRMQEAAAELGVTAERAAQIESSLTAAHRARHQIAQVDQGWSRPDPEGPERDVRLSSVAPSSEAQVESLQRRVEALQIRNADLEGDKRRLSQQIEQLQNLVEQLQFALESTLEDLDRAGRESAEQEQRASELPPADPSPDSEPPAAAQLAPEQTPATDMPLEPPAPAESRTQAALWSREPPPSGVGVVPAPSSTMAVSERDNPLELQAALAERPRDVGLLHGLFEGLGRAADLDRRWCIAQVLVFLEDADVEEIELYEEHRQEGLARPRRALNDDEWRELLMHPQEDPLTGEILAVIAPAVLLGHLTAIRASIPPEVLDPDTRVDPRASTLQAVRCMDWAAALLGLPTPPLYVCPDHDGSADVVLNPAPSTRLGKRALSGRATRELAFLAGQHLSWYRPEHLLGAPNRSVRRLEDMFLAALMIGNPGLPITNEVKERVEPIARTISPLLDRASVERLQHGFSRFAEEGGRTNLSRWLKAVDKTACRAGLLLAGDLWAARDMLLAEGAGQIDEALDDLILFFTSERASALRKRIGIAVTGV